MFHLADPRFLTCLKEYKKPLFDGVSLEKKAHSIYQALCLPVSVDELLQANQLGVSRLGGEFEWWSAET